ncbi:MAG: carboxypeptidase regulatory-like domain-containing protein, partial [Planctomycetota bacterium]
MKSVLAVAAAVTAMALVVLVLLTESRESAPGPPSVSHAVPPDESEASDAVELLAPPVEPPRVEVSAPAPAAEPTSNESESVAPAGTVASARDATIEGRVVAGAGAPREGEPIEGAVVTCRGTETRSDPEGRFRLRVASKGYIGVIVRAEGYRPGGVTPGAVRAGETTTVEVQLEPELGLEWSVHGYVRTGRGAVVADALVRCEVADERETRSDATGFYRLRGLKLEPGVLAEVTAEFDGFARASAYAEGVEPPPEDGIELDLVLRTGARVAGRVLDSSGDPVARGLVWLGDHPGFASNARTATDRQGRFQFESIRARRTLLGFEKRGHPTDVRTITPIDEETLFVEIRLPEAAPLSGRVVDATGAAVVGAVVTARRRDPSDRIRMGSRGSVARTDTDGTFTIEGVSLGSIDLQATSGDHSPSTLVVEHPSTDEVVLVLQERILLRGRVTDAVTGNPIERFRVRLELPRDLGGKRWFDGIDGSWVYGGRPFESLDGRWVTAGEDPFAAGVTTL